MKKETIYHITDQTLILSDLDSQMLHFFSNSFIRPGISKESGIDFYLNLKKLISKVLWGLDDESECRDSDVYQIVYHLWAKLIPKEKFQRLNLEKMQYVYGLGHLKLYYSEDIPIYFQECTCMISQLKAEQFAINRQGVEGEYDLIYLLKRPNPNIGFKIDENNIKHKHIVDSRKSVKEITVKQSRKDWWYQNQINQKFNVQECLYQGDFKDIEFIGSKPSTDPSAYYKVIDGEWKNRLIYKYDTTSW